MNKRIIDGMSAKQIADGCVAMHSRVELEEYLESLCKPAPTWEEYISRLERAVRVLANTNSDWDMNVSVWDRELILSVMDYMSMAEMKKNRVCNLRLREEGEEIKNES